MTQTKDPPQMTVAARAEIAVLCKEFVRPGKGKGRPAPHLVCGTCDATYAKHYPSDKALPKLADWVAPEKCLHFTKLGGGQGRPAPASACAVCGVMQMNHFSERTEQGQKYTPAAVKHSSSVLPSMMVLSPKPGKVALVKLGTESVKVETTVADVTEVPAPTVVKPQTFQDPKKGKKGKKAEAATQAPVVAQPEAAQAQPQAPVVAQPDAVTQPQAQPVTQPKKGSKKGSKKGATEVPAQVTEAQPESQPQPTTEAPAQVTQPQPTEAQPEPKVMESGEPTKAGLDGMALWVKQEKQKEIIKLQGKGLSREEAEAQVAEDPAFQDF